MKFNHLIILSLLLNFACNPASKNAEITSSEFIKNKEAREDSLELAEAYQLQSKISKVVIPSFQTDFVDEAIVEDAADDPAFWFNESNPKASVIYGSNKKGGIYAYDLSGKTLAYYPVGEVNNIDVRPQINFGSKKLDIIGGSNRTNNSIYIMSIDSVGALLPLGSLEIDPSFVDEVYGFCLAKTADEKALAVVNGKNGQIAAYSLDLKDEVLSFEKNFEWKLNTQPEGIVVDDVNGLLYAGEEQMGIWKMDLSEGSVPSLIVSSTQAENEQISYDIEGLSLYKMENPWHEEGVLIASIQGSFTYAIFDLSDQNEYIGSFKIKNSDLIDGVEETDGLEVVNYEISDTFPQGMLIVQDGFNTENGEAVSQNFKVINMQDLLDF